MKSPQMFAGRFKGSLPLLEAAIKVWAHGYNTYAKTNLRYNPVSNHPHFWAPQSRNKEIYDENKKFIDFSTEKAVFFATTGFLPPQSIISMKNRFSG